MRKRAEFLIKEIVDGIGETGVRCGLIGEMGCSSPLTDNEKKSLKAAALAQKRTGIYNHDKSIYTDSLPHHHSVFIY